MVQYPFSFETSFLRKFGSKLIASTIDAILYFDGHVKSLLEEFNAFPCDSNLFRSAVEFRKWFL